MHRVIAFIVLVLAAARAASASVSADEQTAAAVTAIEHRWSQAELRGDVAYLQDLLSPAYQSVGANGVAYGKAAIIAGALRHANDTKLAAMVAAFERTSTMAVSIEGDTAIATFYLVKLGPEHGIESSDVFAYTQGRWRAVYSQHSSIGS